MTQQVAYTDVNIFSLRGMRKTPKQPVTVVVQFKCVYRCFPIAWKRYCDAYERVLCTFRDGKSAHRFISLWKPVNQRSFLLHLCADFHIIFFSLRMFSTSDGRTITYRISRKRELCCIVNALHAGASGTKGNYQQVGMRGWKRNFICRNKNNSMSIPQGNFGFLHMDLHQKFIVTKFRFIHLDSAVRTSQFYCRVRMTVWETRKLLRGSISL